MIRSASNPVLFTNLFWCEYYCPRGRKVPIETESLGHQNRTIIRCQGFGNPATQSTSSSILLPHCPFVQNVCLPYRKVHDECSHCTQAVRGSVEQTLQSCVLLPQELTHQKRAPFRVAIIGLFSFCCPPSPIHDQHIPVRG